MTGSETEIVVKRLLDYFAKETVPRLLWCAVHVARTAAPGVLAPWTAATDAVNQYRDMFR